MIVDSAAFTPELDQRDFSQQSEIYNLKPVSFLAFWAVMTAAPGDHDSLDGCLADQTCFRFATVDAVLELEEPFLAVGVHIVGDGRAAERDRFLEHFFHGQEELAELVAGNAGSAAARADAGAE